MNKNEIADVLLEIAVLLELKGENPFKIRAYQSGARALEAIEEVELARLIQAEKLGTVKGFGEALVQKVTELFTTGRLEFFEQLKASVRARGDRSVNPNPLATAGLTVGVRVSAARPAT